MRKLISSRRLVALAIVLSAGLTGQAQNNTSSNEPAPPTVAESSLPPEIPPNSALAQVYKLIQAGMDENVIKNYIANSQSAFDLDAEEIIALNDAGAPSDLINAMMEHDKNFSNLAPAPAPSSSTETVVDTAPPTEPVTVNYFYDSLSPYGSWVDVAGYGRCWRPTVVIYDSSWQPYCDRGHWVYTDYGWYWDSDYSWGVAFHYGRWFRDTHYGWCWYPQTTWGPSWVTWRSGGDYCGWAPLPPFTEFRGGGFYYRGASVSVGFDFGLPSTCFTFVSVNHFCDRRVRYYSVHRDRVGAIYRETKVVHNYGDRDHHFVNHGIDVARVRQATHRELKPVDVGQLPRARREGWRGPVSSNPDRSNPQLQADFRRENRRANNVNNNQNAHSGTPKQTGSPVNRQQTHHVQSPVSSGNNNAAPVQNRDQNTLQQNRENRRENRTAPNVNVPQNSGSHDNQSHVTSPENNTPTRPPQRIEQRQQRITGAPQTSPNSFQNNNVQPRQFTQPSQNPSFQHGAPRMMEQRQQRHSEPAISAPVQHVQPQRQQRVEQRQSAVAPSHESAPTPAPSQSSDRGSGDHDGRFRNR